MVTVYFLPTSLHNKNQLFMDRKIGFKTDCLIFCTFPQTNIAPENGWLEYYFPIGEAYFQGLR